MLIIPTLMMMIAAPTVAMAADARDWLALVQEISASEGVDPAIMVAIGVVESGRKLPGGVVAPWPYAVRLPDGAHYPQSRAEAERLILDALAHGVRPYQIDAGAMQINLRWARHHLGRMLAAVDPATNIRVAARMLAAAMGTNGELDLRIGRYHTARPQLARRYGRRVLAIAARLSPHLHLPQPKEAPDG